MPAAIPTTSPLGLALREARLKGHLTQAQLAERVGVTQGNVSQWEHGAWEPKYGTVRAVERACGLRPGGLSRLAAKFEGGGGQPVTLRDSNGGLTSEYAFAEAA